ncbi:activated CDC42 kinase 1-like [Rhineura floridana]|uniref:activated CDC42 kinase 1-like n=1 Tax=Rhineura floridana TaxID=261503 RepID=UPI002AC86991|nr:activated CDC42 kinase 1-like [Rhineura floridana]
MSAKRRVDPLTSTGMAHPGPFLPMDLRSQKRCGGLQPAAAQQARPRVTNGTRAFPERAKSSQWKTGPLRRRVPGVQKTRIARALASFHAPPPPSHKPGLQGEGPLVLPLPKTHHGAAPGRRRLVGCAQRCALSQSGGGGVGLPLPPPPPALAASPGRAMRRRRWGWTEPGPPATFSKAERRSGSAPPPGSRSREGDRCECFAER